MQDMATTADRHADQIDVLIIGAGLSGIDAAYRVQTECPHLSYAILEARDAIGGTWDLFRYPGIRSDSDMVTLGFPFRPWRGKTSIVAGDAIRRYVVDTAREFGIDRHIRFHTRMTGAAWSSRTARWTVDIETASGTRQITARFLYMASGYYDYAGGFTPDFPGLSDFAGKVVHPQHWPEDLDYSGKRVVVIGSGATAITLVPSLLPKADHVVMLQRSPTYIVEQPAADPNAAKLRKVLPTALSDWAVRWKNVGFGIVTYRMARKHPEKMKKILLDRVRDSVGPEHYDPRDFTPRYNPWDQRICVVPDGDLFAAIRSGQAEVVTGTIKRFVAEGIELDDGQTLKADIVVTATGLKLQMFGGATLSVDGKDVSTAGRLMYRGLMLEGIPNFAFAFGYTNASWTLKCDLSARYFCRVLNHMEKRGEIAFVPRANGAEGSAPMVALASGYVQRAADALPRQGEAAPWKLHQNYLFDKLDLEWKSIDDGVLTFTKAA